MLWLVKFSEIVFNTDLSPWGIYPRDWQSIYTIFSGPLIHGNFAHLFNNSVPLLILSVALFYSYRPLHYKVFFLIFILTGIGTWLIGRSSYHIGASGIIYGLVSFIFWSGIIRRDIRLMSLSAFTILFYGSLVWGIFPIDYKMSWEGHLMGAIAGTACAIYYRHKGPQRKVYEWETHPEPDEENIDFTVIEGNPEILETPPATSDEIKIVYHYKKDE